MFRYVDFDINPWRLLDQWLDSGPSAGPGVGPGLSSRFPRVNVWEGDEEIILDAELPGVDPKEVELSVEGSEISLAGLVGLGGEREDAPRFERRFELPFEVDADKVQALYKQGVLRVTMPKAPDAKRRKIEITA